MSGSKANIIYLIVGIVVLILVIAYYVNHVFNQVKGKMFLPTQQKLAALEANVKEVEQRVVAGTRQKKEELSLLSASYRSDGSKHGNMSLVYGDLSEGAAAEILDKVARGQHTKENGRDAVTKPQRNIFEDANPHSITSQASSDIRRRKKGSAEEDLFNATETDQQTEQRTPSNIFDDPLEVDFEITDRSATATPAHITERSSPSRSSLSGMAINKQAVKNISDNIRRAASDRSLSPLSAVLASPSPKSQKAQ